MADLHGYKPRRNSYPKIHDSSTTTVVTTVDDSHSLDIPSTPTELLKQSQQSALLSPSSSPPSSSLYTAFIISSWYMSNIGILLLNKHLFSSNTHSFKFPIFLTLLHMLSSSALSSLTISFLSIPKSPLVSVHQFLKILSLSFLFSLSVVAGNASLRFLPVSFNQAVGATTPFFTAVFSLLLTVNREPLSVYLSLLPVVAGVAIASNSEPLFHLVGFIFCLASTAGRALKSVVQGIILSDESEKLDSINLLMYMAPMAAAMLLPMSLVIEGNVMGILVEKARSDPSILLIIAANMIIAYLVNLTNFLVTKHTSALTLQVLGNAKSVIAAIISVMVFRNPVTVMGMTGFAIAIAGVALYREAKQRAKAQR